MSEMERSIILSLSYFSIFNYPLTAIELWQYLLFTNAEKANFEQYLIVLNDLSKKNIISNKFGFIFLPGEEESIQKRQDNYRDSFAKYEIAKRIIKLFSLIPFVKAIFVCNSLAYNNSCQQGDIDLFIIVKNNRLWLTRFIVLGVLKIFNLRPLKNNKQNKIDPTFFLNEKDLSLEEISLNNDIYLTYWLAQLTPIYDPENFLIKLRQANTQLLDKLPNGLPASPHHRRLVQKNWLTCSGQIIFGLLANYDLFEILARRFQLKIMPELLKKQLNNNKGVIANSKMIKMHSNDRRQEYSNNWNQICGSIFASYENKS